MLGKVLGGIFVLVLLFAGFGTIISEGIHNLRTDEQVQNNIVVTGMGITTADVVLTHALFNDNTAQVASITSTLAETPVATTYTAATKTLTISALTANDTRTLTISYYTELDDEYMQIIGPFLTFFIFGGILAGVAWGIWQGFGKRRHSRR